MITEEGLDDGNRIKDVYIFVGGFAAFVMTIIVIRVTTLAITAHVIAGITKNNLVGVRLRPT